MAVSTGCYLLAVIGEPVSDEHKQIILQRLNKGLLSWDTNATGCDLKGIESVCASVTDKTALENDLLIQHSTESLGVEVLVNPTVSTLRQCVKNLLTSSIGHKHIIHAGYTFTGSGSWIMQNGAYSFEDFLSAFKDAQVQSQKGCTIHVHCIEEGDWNSRNFEQEVFSKVATVSLNPLDKLDQLPGAKYLVDCLESVLSTQSLTEIMEASPLVGNIRFNRPTLYLFPAGQGDCALFGINGFNMLVDGGFNRKPCSWEFIRHLDRLDAVLVTRLSESNLCSMSTLMKRKTLNNTYPQIGYVFCNIAEGKNSSPTEEMQKDKNELLVSVVGEGHQFINTLNDLKLVPHQCWCDSSTEPFILYHKVGHGTLEMHVLSPPKDNKEMKDFLSEWSSYKENFSCVKTGLKGKNQGALIPLSHATSVCAILIWRPNDPKDTITRILFPGSAPQNKIFEGLEKLKNLDILKQPTVTKASLSTILISKTKKLNGPVSKASMPNRKHTASPALSISSMASRNGDVPALKKEIKELKADNKVAKEVKRVTREIKKETKVTKELKKDNKEMKDVKKEVKDSKISTEKKTASKPAVKKSTSNLKSATDVKKSLKKETTKKEVSAKSSATKPESKTKSPSTKTIESKTAKEVMNKKAAETKTVSKPKSKPTAASLKASPSAPKSKATPVPKSPSKLSRAIAASAAVATAAVTVGVAELIESKKEEIEKEEDLKIEIEEDIVEKEEINILQNAMAHEDEVNVEQEEIPVSPLRHEAVSPALSEPVSLTASDTLSSAPIETVSPTPPPHEIASPIEEKEVNEIKELYLGTPTAEEKLLNQEVNEMPSNIVPEIEDIRESSVDEGIAETDIIEDDNLAEVDQINNGICESPTPEPVEAVIVKNEINTNLMTASFVAESLEQAEEEFLSRQSAVQDEVERRMSEISKANSNEIEGTYEENIDEGYDYENQINAPQDTAHITDIDAQLASASMEGSFCAGMTGTVHDDTDDYNTHPDVEDKIIKELSFPDECRPTMETSIVFTDIQANEIENSYEIKESENYETISENTAIENLDIPDYQQELNLSLEVNVQDSHSEISTQESDIKSEEVQQMSNADDNRLEGEVNIEDDARAESTLVRNLPGEEIPIEEPCPDEEIHVEDPCPDEIHVEDPCSDEVHMEETSYPEADNGFSNKKETMKDSPPDFKIEENLHNLDNDNFTEDTPSKETDYFEKEENSKESFIEKDIDESITTIEHSLEVAECDHATIENQPNDDQIAYTSSKTFPETEFMLEEGSQKYVNLHSSEHEVPPSHNFPENISGNENYDSEEEFEKPVESSVSLIHDEQDNKTEDVTQSEDDVDIQQYMSKDCADDMDRQKLSPSIPYKVSDSDDDNDDIAKSPVLHDYQNQKSENQTEIEGTHEDKSVKSNFSEEKQIFDEKDHDSTEEEEMIRYPSPPGSQEFYQQVGPNKNLDEMRDPITQHYISSVVIGKNEEPLYEEPEDSGSERSQSPVVGQPVFSNIEKVDFPELVNVSGGTTPSEPQSPKSPLDSKKGNLGALEIEVMEALSEHDCSESSSQSPLVCDEANAFDLGKEDTQQMTKREQISSETQLEYAAQSLEESSNVLESDKKSETDHGKMTSEMSLEQESDANAESHKLSDLGYNAHDASESDFAYQPESDFLYGQTSELVCKPESEQHCESQPGSQFEAEIHYNEHREILHEDIQTENTEINFKQEETNLGEIIAENADVEKAYDECGFLPPADFANEDEVLNKSSTQNIESMQTDLTNTREETSHQDIDLIGKDSNNAVKSDLEDTKKSYDYGKDKCEITMEERDSAALHGHLHEASQLKESDHDSPESHQNEEHCKEQEEFEKENKYTEETTLGATKHNEEYDDSNKAIPESERHYGNGFSTSNIGNEQTDYSTYTSDIQVPPHGMNGQGTNSWEMYSNEYSGVNSSYNSNYNSTYTEINTTKMISGEQQITYVTDTDYQSDSPEDNSMKNSSTPDAPSPSDPEIVEDPLNPLSLDPPIAYDGINNKFIPTTDDYHQENMNYINAAPPPLKNKNSTNVDRPYGESSEEEDSSSLPGNVSPYAYTNKAYNQEEEEDADGNHIIKPPLGLDQSTDDGNPISTYDSNNPQNFPENLTFESHHQRVNSGLGYSPGFNQDMNTADPPAYDFRLEEWGKPMGLPTPPDATTKTTKKPVKTATSKSTVKTADKRSSLENTNGKVSAANTKLMSSPLKKVKEAASSNSTPVYVDLAYVPHHGDPHYSDVEFFKRIRARYYVFSGINPSKEVLNALLDAKKSWNEDLETTIIPTYETDTLGYWMAQNQEALTEYSIDVAPSASRCTVNLQDHETSCAAYRLEF